MIANRAAIEKLIVEMTADDKQMTPGPWRCNEPHLAIEGDLEHQDGPVLIAELGGEVMLEDGPAIVRARNNLPAVAAMFEGLLESAENDRLEIERLHREVAVARALLGAGEQETLRKACERVESARAEWRAELTRKIERLTWEREARQLCMTQLVNSRAEATRLSAELYEANVEVAKTMIANNSLIPNAMLTVSEIACLTVERDAARKEVERMRPVVEAAEWIRRGARGGGYAITTSLAFEDRRLFDKFNLAVDAYLYPDNLYRGEK